MAKETRANKKNLGVSQNRYETYKNVMNQYKKAIDNEFYLEATALAESLISDRLESRLEKITGAPVLFETLGKTRTLLSTLEQYHPIKFIIDNDINSWTEKRNIAIHQAAKVGSLNPKDWNKFLIECKKTAKEGMAIFRKLDNKMRLKAAHV
jgi:hypothetical protein